MKVHVTDIATAGSRVCETDLGVQVCSVEVNLTTILMNYIASLFDTVFKHTESGWIRNLEDKLRLGT